MIYVHLADGFEEIEALDNRGSSARAPTSTLRPFRLQAKSR